MVLDYYLFRYENWFYGIIIKCDLHAHEPYFFINDVSSLAIKKGANRDRINCINPHSVSNRKRRALLLQIEQKELCMYYSKIPLLHPINKRKIN